MLPLSKPNILKADIESVSEVLQSGDLVQGKNVENLEYEFSRYHGISYAIAVSNGTAALHLSLLALGIGVGDEVIVTAYSFIASANAIVLTGATPVFCDTGNNSFNIDAKSIESLVSSKTKALLIVHEFGIPADMDEIMKLSRNLGIPVVEDAACALGSRYKDQNLGTFGVISCFSFHPRKLITSGEGGMILTTSQKICNFLKSMRNHGLDVEASSRSYINAGFNYRMTEISAALLLKQLSRLTDIVNKRQSIASRYFTEIKNSSILLPILPQNIVNNWQTFPVRLASENEKKLFVAHAKRFGVSALPPAQFIPSESYYVNSLQNDRSFPNAKRLFIETVALPMYELMTDMDVSLVIEVCNEFKNRK